MKVKTNNEIIQAVKHAQEKHPYFAQNFSHAVCLAAEELGETARAVNEGDWPQVKAEALDTIAVLVRLIYMVDSILEED